MLVTSNKGGVDTEDVVITGAEDASVGVVAAIQGDLNTVQIGQTVTLDGLASTGTITSYAWSVTPAGATVTPVAADGSSVTFKATAAGTYTVKLTVTGKSNTSTDTYTIEVLNGNAEPVANAGPDQLGVVPTSTVTLDGTASKFASSFSWAQDPADQVQLGTEPEEPDDGEPDVRGPGLQRAADVQLHADHQGRQRHRVDRHGAGRHRPGRRHGGQRVLQARRPAVAGLGIGQVLLGQQPDQRLLEQAGHRWRHHSGADRHDLAGADARRLRPGSSG